MDGEGRIFDAEAMLTAMRAGQLMGGREPRWWIDQDGDEYILDGDTVAMAGLLFGVAVQVYRGEAVHPMLLAYMDAAQAIRDGRMDEAVEIVTDLKRDPAIANRLTNPVDSYRADVRTISAIGQMVEMMRSGERDVEAISRSKYQPNYGTHGKAD